ncbi:type II toxin-antitoxin system death-on-curing family toxin [Aerococcaceae bacterium NML191292]|nr:type II toxin-antitoxin system death-on-curing family toxin [Aerococcaceae bacterium NML210727]MCW6655378.1 type II toxin-antitoxin system death-on-curing family toxin [Aerococcaceae bacterium NML201296]MCW6660488.1 type II toxin-antitoxin system death-on-curing family toxin [Aerococcaceae bacterium NML191292]MCW6660611.1 type II toxin-antitoxin system death-on-curing family toxin [Aerococcaceae bacterium NML201209]MCW6680353.1 type II toxin-antitoxin system death-on-curing family toxin [Aer
MNYFDLDYALMVHDLVIEESGGRTGIKDIGQLESVLTHIQNDTYYPTFEDKLTHLVFSVIQFHMFIDGNKRTSLLLGAYFMNLNHYTYYIDNFIVEMENIVVAVASGRMTKEELQDRITKIINSDDI